MRRAVDAMADPLRRSELNLVLRAWINPRGGHGWRCVPKAGMTSLNRWCMENGWRQVRREGDGPVLWAPVRDPKERWYSAVGHWLSHGSVDLWVEGADPVELLDRIITLGGLPSPLFWPQHYFVAGAVPVLFEEMSEWCPGFPHENRGGGVVDRSRWEPAWPVFERLYEPDYRLRGEAL